MEDVLFSFEGLQIGGEEAGYRSLKRHFHIEGWRISGKMRKDKEDVRSRQPDCDSGAGGTLLARARLHSGHNLREGRHGFRNCQMLLRQWRSIADGFGEHLQGEVGIRANK